MENKLIIIWQTFLTYCMFQLEHLEVLNIYNCTRWYCGGVPLGVLLLTIINFICFPKIRLITGPTIISLTYISGSLLFWDFEHWNISTRHRTEYYDTHCFSAVLLWIMLLWYVFYLYIYTKLMDTVTALQQNELPV